MNWHHPEATPWKKISVNALCLCCLALLVSSSALLGRQAPPPAENSKSQQAEAEAPEVAKKAEQEPIPRYMALDRRDPFQNLANLQVKPQATKIIGPPPLSQRPPGLSGLLISEVSVVGMAEQSDKKIVVLRGTDKFTYMAREGTKLFDGVLMGIEGEKVVFERTVRDTAGNEISSKVVKQ